MFSGRMLVKTRGSPDQVCKHGQEMDSAEQAGRGDESRVLDSRTGEKRYTPPAAPLEVRKKFKIVAGF
jgi:hypothetical protein